MNHADHFENPITGDHIKPKEYGTQYRLTPVNTLASSSMVPLCSSSEEADTMRAHG